MAKKTADDEPSGRVEIIDLHPITHTCCICGQEDLSRWGVPIDSGTGLVVANEFTGDWCGKPACRDCWRRHDNGELVGHDPGF